MVGAGGRQWTLGNSAGVQDVVRRGRKGEHREATVSLQSV